ncbi:XRE family transcriptional regulator [Streptomyces bauhiniae]|uniref:XRE family transcriptional regulator n=1 Tax=Streptomyces bauhiniae TaxID=2340725 RepID=UPI00365528D1
MTERRGLGLWLRERPRWIQLSLVPTGLLLWWGLAGVVWHAVSGHTWGDAMTLMATVGVSTTAGQWAAMVIDQMTGHLAALEDALNFAVLPSARRPVALALAGASTLAAWQAVDSGAIERAWRHYETAKSAARDAEARMYLAHAMGEQAFVLCAAGRPALGVELVRDAQRSLGQSGSPRLRAWLHATEAELCAHSGMVDDCRRALDKASGCIPDGPEDRDPDMLSIFLNGSHLTRWRGNVLGLLGDAEAVSSLYDALQAMDPTFVRARAGLHTDLAHAHLARAEYDDAQTHLRQARLLASRTGSVRQRRRVDLLSERL